MWPVEKSSPEFVRIGRHTVERWKGQRGELLLVERCHVERSSPWDSAALSEALQRVVRDAGQARISVLIESAWLPVAAVSVGPVWRKKEVTALLLHRFASLYRSADAKVQDWEIQTGFRVGDNQALGFGLHPLIKQVMDQVALGRGRKWHAVLPALAWGLAGCSATRRWAREPAWIFWPEQDRQLIARVQSGRLHGFNPCSELSRNPAQLARLIAIERVRLGIADDSAGIEVATWDAAQSLEVPDLKLSWHRLASFNTSALLTPLTAHESVTT